MALINDYFGVYIYIFGVEEEYSKKFQMKKFNFLDLPSDLCDGQYHQTKLEDLFDKLLPSESNKIVGIQATHQNVTNINVEKERVISASKPVGIQVAQCVTNISSVEKESASKPVEKDTVALSMERSGANKKTSIEPKVIAIQCKNCVVCGEMFGSNASLYRHYFSNHLDEIKLKKCPNCGQLFRSAKNFAKHVKKFSTEYKCPHCSQQFCKSDKFNRHVNNHFKRCYVLILRGQQE